MLTASQMTTHAAQSKRRASALERIQPATMVPERPDIHAARRASVAENFASGGAVMDSDFGILNDRPLAAGGGRFKIMDVFLIPAIQLVCEDIVRFRKQFAMAWFADLTTSYFR